MMNHEKRYCDCSICRLTEVKSVQFALWTVEEGLKGLTFAGVLAFTIAVLAGTPYELFVAPKAAENIERLAEINVRIGDMSEQLSQLEAQNTALYGRLFRTSMHLNAPPSDADTPERFSYLGGAGPSPLDSAIFTVRDAAFDLGRELSRQRNAAEKREEWIDQSPIVLPANGNIASGFGMRLHPITERNQLHQGIDIVLTAGTPIYATGAGLISMTDSTHGYGIHVRILHPATGHLTIYAHLSRVPPSIRIGRWVERGDLIGFSGDSGLATGPHLHYEIRSAHGLPIDPMEFLMLPQRSYVPQRIFRSGWDWDLYELFAERSLPSHTAGETDPWIPVYGHPIQQTPQRRAATGRR